MSLSVSRTTLGLSLIALFTYALFAGLEMPFRASMLPVLASGLALPLTLLAIYIERKTENERQTQADESSGDLAVSEDEVSSDEVSMALPSLPLNVAPVPAEEDGPLMSDRLLALPFSAAAAARSALACAAR